MSSLTSHFTLAGGPITDYSFANRQLWSTSVQDGPAGYPLGFIVCSAACGLAIIHSFFIR